MGKCRNRKLTAQRCHYCGKECGRKYTWDHIVPVALGGCNLAWNIVPACDECNNKKGSTFPEAHCAVCVQSIMLHALDAMPSLDVPFDRLPVVDWGMFRPGDVNKRGKQVRPEPEEPPSFDCS